jgi:hypothetical protein
MKLAPLQEWICDECREVIDDADRGHMEWMVDEGDRAWGFRIVHHGRRSPRAGDAVSPARGTDCHRYRQHASRYDLDLSQFIGTDGLVEMLAFLDPGPDHVPRFTGPRVRDVRELVEIVRRLHVPYYEEARLYWDRARRDGFFDGMNEVVIFLPFTLKSLVEKYGSPPS